MSSGVVARAVASASRTLAAKVILGVLVVPSGLVFKSGCVAASRPAIDDSLAPRVWVGGDNDKNSQTVTRADSRPRVGMLGSWWRRLTQDGPDRSQPPLLPDRHVVRIGPFQVYSGRPLPPDSPEALALATLPARIASTLGIAPEPHAAPTVVYLLDNHARFAHFLRHHHPDLPDRRAFFIAEGPQRRVIYAFWGERLAEDLRHEGTHALFHAAGLDLPLWLDEGLAECFEVPEGPRAPAWDHLARLLAAWDQGWIPDLNRLERLSEIETMSLRDYSESWAWTHWLIDPDISDSLPNPHPALMAHLTAFLRDPERRARALGHSPAPSTRSVASLSWRLESAQVVAPAAASESSAPRDAQARLALFTTFSEEDLNRRGSDLKTNPADSSEPKTLGPLEQGLIDHLKRLSLTQAGAAQTPHQRVAPSRNFAPNPRVSARPSSWSPWRDADPDSPTRVTPPSSGSVP